MPSKMVTDRQKSSLSVQAACATHAKVMAAGVAATLADPSLEPVISVVVQKAAHRLKAVTDAMVAADDENLRERLEDQTARDARDEVAARLRADLVSLRSGVANVLGDAAVRTLGFDGDTPKDPAMVERLANTVVESLDKLATVEPQPGFTFDPAPWKTRIKDHVVELAAARSKLGMEERETEGTLAAKDKAVAAYDTTFVRVATLASALLTIAGEPELARRVRPSARKPGQTVEHAQDPVTPEQPGA